MTDTDSLCIEIKGDASLDFYKDLNEDSDKYDTSDFNSDNPYGIELKNKKVLDLFKDEMSGKPITEFVGLRSKLYSFRASFGRDSEARTRVARDSKTGTVEEEEKIYVKGSRNLWLRTLHNLKTLSTVCLIRDQ